MKQADTPRMERHPGGRYALHFPGGRLSGLVSAVEIQTGNGPLRLASSQTVWASPVTGELPITMSALLADGLTLELTGQHSPSGVGLLLTLSLHNQGSARVRVRRLFPLLFDAESMLSLSIPSAARDLRWGIYKQGYQSCSFAGWVPLEAPDIHPRFFMTRPVHADPTWPAPDRGRYQSEGMFMLGCASWGPVLVAGYTGGGRMLGRFELAAASAATTGPAVPLTGLEAWCEADGIALNPGDSLRAEPLWVGIGREQETLDAYAMATSQAMKARVAATSPTVWRSLSTGQNKASEKELLEATIALRTRSQTHPVQVIQLDDGYMRTVGDWLEPSGRFPHGLGWLANQVSQAGFVPGLSLCPFIALSRSHLFQQHRDWFIKSVDGTPVPLPLSTDWGARYYALDLTHPEVGSWLHDLISQVVSMGFRYLKLDALFAGAVAGIRFDPQVTRAATLRRGLEIIRQAAGETTFLLASGCPLLPAVGLVDAMRTGPDTAATWNFRFKGFPILPDEPGVPAAKNAIRNTLTRQWMHRRFWLNDPDSLPLRESATRLSQEEVKSLLLVGGLTGGLLSFTESIEQLSPVRLDWLRRAIPGGARWVEPVTLLGEETPSLSVGRHGPWLVALAVNLSDQPRPFKLKWASLGLDPQAVCHLYDGWEGQYLGTRLTECDAGILPPHGSRLLVLRPASGLPEVVGSTFHLHPAQVIAGEERQEGALLLRLGNGARGPGQITLAVPPPYQAGRAQAEGANLVQQKNAPFNGMVLELLAAPGAVIRIHYRSG